VQSNETKTCFAANVFTTLFICNSTKKLSITANKSIVIMNKLLTLLENLNVGSSDQPKYFGLSVYNF